MFLNHGSFGACEESVIEEYQRLQIAMERQPVEWLGRRADELLGAARLPLAEFVGCAADELVHVPNPTTAVNIVARSLELRPGDEVLATDHEYGAMDRTWRVVCNAAGARYVRVAVPLSPTGPDEVVERVWSAVTPRTRVLFISHITSATAQRFPVEELVLRARASGLVTIVDGAHVPAHLPLDLHASAVDFATGANHKWLGAPKGSSFLYARRDVQHLLRPLVVSWGWEAEQPSGSTFVDHHEWQGTRDLSAFLATPAAIAATNRRGWREQQPALTALLRSACAAVDDLTGCPPVYADEWCRPPQMAVVRLPPVDPVALKRRLYDEYRVELPVHRVGDDVVMRISIAPYNDQADVDSLCAALTALLPQLALR